MEKRVIDLEIIDDLEGSGVDAIALVDSPAIEKNFMYFRAEQFVEPKSGESESDYMGRCVPVLIGEGKEQDQAVAICISTYENMALVDNIITCDVCGHSWDVADGGEDLYVCHECGHDNEMLKVDLEINTGGLAPYTDQSGPLKRKAVLASVDELAVGDDVSWKTADKNPRGRITEIVTGAKKVPGVDFEIQGTEEDPGYIIEIYEEVDGKWEPTGKYVGRKADSILKNVQLAAVHNYSKMMFADDDKKEIVAIAMVPDMEIPRKDKNGNIYWVKFSKGVIAKIAEKYMREQRLADTNIQHVDSADAGAYVFESYIVETEDDKANTLYGLGAPVGAWVVKMRVTNLETWAKVKSGELKGLSIQGSFLDQNEYEAYLKDKKMYNDLVRLVSTF